jgi:hypothetical protein
MPKEKGKIEFVEKMKRENPRAYDFLGRSATGLLLSLENDLVKELADWFVRAIKVCGIQKTKDILESLLSEIDKEDKE